MIALWVILGSMTAVAIGSLLRVAQLERAMREDSHIDHAICTAHVASVVSRRVVAQAVHNLAEKWGTIENQAGLQRLAREKWQPDGPSVPALWLHEQARLIEEEGK